MHFSRLSLRSDTRKHRIKHIVRHRWRKKGRRARTHEKIRRHYYFTLGTTKIVANERQKLSIIDFYSNFITSLLNRKKEKYRRGAAELKSRGEIVIRSAVLRRDLSTAEPNPSRLFRMMTASGDVYYVSESKICALLHRQRRREMLGRRRERFRIQRNTLRAAIWKFIFMMTANAADGEIFLFYAPLKRE